MVSVIRPDCRSVLELRAFSSEVGLISEADGSARCRMGETNVVVAVYGPAQARYQRQEDYSAATIDVELRVCGFTGQDAMSVEKEAASFLTPALAECIELHKYPRQVISFKVTVVNNDGAMQSCALHACALALVSAGIELNAIPSSVTICGSSSGSSSGNGAGGNNGNGADDEEDNSGLVFCVDPVLSEEEGARCKVVLAFGNIFSEDPPVMSTRMTGAVGYETMREAIRQASAANRATADIMQDLARV